MPHLELNAVPGARRFYWLAALLLGSSTGCALLLPGRDWQLTGSSNTRTLLVSDSPAVRKLITEEDAREEIVSRFFRQPHTQEEGSERIKDMMRYPDQFPPGRSAFLTAMTQMPGTYVPGKSYCKIIERSKSRCGRSPLETAIYLLVEVTTGSSRRQRGWVCENVVGGGFP
jgi:hypothetical protein